MRYSAACLPTKPAHNAARRAWVRNSFGATLSRARRAALIIAAICVTMTLRAQEESVPKFGTTVVIPSGLRGEIYHIHGNTSHLPDLRKQKPVGVIYTESLNVPTQNFQQGFPGVTKRF